MVARKEEETTQECNAEFQRIVSFRGGGERFVAD
jgi:hypothetical protein